MYAYTFYLFFDFAGYSAFAIGFSYIFGIHTPENFNRPFISRDIRDLNLSKTSQGYALPQGDGGVGAALPPVSRLVREFVLDIRSAQNLLVIKTIVGSAQPVAAALDETDWSELVGTIAGDDTILIVCPDKDQARGLASRIEEMLS